MRIIMIGANNPEVLRLIEDQEKCFQNAIIGFIDNNQKLAGKSFGDYKILGGFEKVIGLVYNNGLEDLYFTNLVTGSTKERIRVDNRVMNKWPRGRISLIHSSVNQSMVSITPGAYIQEGVLIQAGVKILTDVAIHTGAIIAHECKIGAHSFIAHGACLSGKVEVGEGAFIGANATILPRLKIGKWSTVGAGAVVTHDVPDYATVVGNPARELVK